jgi:alcohol dehydrogenase
VSQTFQFTPLERVVFGDDGLEQLPREVERLGGAHALVITGNSIATRTDYVARIHAVLGDRFAGVFSGVRQHPVAEATIGAADAARAAGADLLIALGGGSPIDCAKSTAHALAHDWTTLDEVFEAPQRESHPFPPIVALPTTLSAAEYSPGGGVTNAKTHLKSRLYDLRAMPKVVVIAPELTLATPRELWLSSGIRALDHAVEAIYSKDHQPIVDALALEAVRYLFRALPASVEEPTVLQYRTDCLLAAWMSHFSPTSVEFSVSHALGQQLGSAFQMGHGITSCLTLAPTMRFLAPVTAERQAMLCEPMGLTLSGTPEQRAAAAADAVEAFVTRLGLPTRFSQVGIVSPDFGPVVEAAFRRLADRSPRRHESPHDLLEVLEAAL